MSTRRACGDAVRTRGDFVADRGAEGDMPFAAARARRTRWAWAAACSRAPRGRRRCAWADIPAGYNTPTAWSQTVARLPQEEIVKSRWLPQRRLSADGARARTADASCLSVSTSRAAYRSTGGAALAGFLVSYKALARVGSLGACRNLPGARPRYALRQALCLSAEPARGRVSAPGRDASETTGRKRAIRLYRYRRAAALTAPPARRCPACPARPTAA